jgi:hypothetical protein
MSAILNSLKESFINENIRSRSLATEGDLRRFMDVHNIHLPEDLGEFFETINGTDSKYDENFFQFYSLENFKAIEDRYLDWEGIPDFKAVLKVLPDYQNVFVIADYSIHVISYSIRLFPAQSSENDVYAICGPDYKRVARSFTEFITTYMSNISSLMI